MTAYPYDHDDEWRAAQWRQPESEQRPEPADYQGESVPMKPLWPVADREPERWGSLPRCDDCDEEVEHAWDALCGERKDWRLAEEAHDRGRPGEWGQ